MSKPTNPIELVDRYLQAVRFWLPKTQKQEDLIAELGEDLRSQIEEKETEVGHALDHDEVAAILKRCGAPMLVAARLGPKTHLIGPTLFPIYWFVLKMALFWILVPVFVFIVGPVNVVNSNGDWGSAIGNTFGDLWSGLFIAAGIITLVFAVLERTSAHVQMACKWDPYSLPPVQKQETKTSLAKTFCELIFGVIGLVWILLVPQYPVLILGPAAAFLKAGMLWHTFYAPLVALAFVGLLRSAVILAQPHRPALPLWTQLLQTILSLLVLRFMLSAVLQTRAAGFHPFVTPVSTASAQYVRIAAIVNASLLISVVAACFGLSIALIVQTWEFMRFLRKRTVSGHNPASLVA